MVEGDSDYLVGRALSRRLGLPLEATGSDIVRVGGKANMPEFLKLYRLVGKTPTAIADLDAFVDDDSLVATFSSFEESTAIANASGARSIGELASKVRSDLIQAVDDEWGAIQSVCASHPYLTTRATGTASVDRRRAATAMLLGLSEDELSRWPSGCRFLELRRRLDAALGVLAKVGCVILRKGTIEDYYFTVAGACSDGKRSAAAEEAAHLSEADPAVARVRYADFLVGLERFANVPSGDEALLVTEALLAVVAPALRRPPESLSSGVVDEAARRYHPDAQRLFRFTVSNDGEGRPVIEAQLADDQTQFLDVAGFPISFPYDCNPVAVAKQQIRGKASKVR